MRRVSINMEGHPVTKEDFDAERRLLHWWWQRLSNQLTKGERRRLWLGRALATVDLLITGILREGPSPELAICQKVGN